MTSSPVVPVALIAVVVAAAVVAAPSALQAREDRSSCIVCHSSEDYFDGPALAHVEDHAASVHAEVGLSCHDCHGGNPDPALADDMEAMDPSWPKGPYVGAPARAEVPAFCGTCHSDPVYMKRFRPDARVDQEREYWTSQHGVALAAGDENVATCIDCHAAHGTRRAGDPESAVYPTHVGETCNTCHGDPARMEGYHDPHGDPLAVDQYARWRQSVHAASMFDRQDLSAPTCNDCHGNHGAAPPGLESISFVCGQCHGREAELFRASDKHDALAVHNEYLLEAGDEGCAACHEAPQSEVSSIRSFSECASCHGNHGVVRPNISMLSALPSTPCDFCHDPAATASDEPGKILQSFQQARKALLAQGSDLGLADQDLFDWLVEQTELLPQHGLPGGETENRNQLKPEVQNLFDKFRIGRSYFLYDDPVTGEPTRAKLVQCGDCHARSDDSRGHATEIEALDRMRELTTATARAERILLAARRGGVETREALADIEQAVDAEIGLEVLLHTFEVGDGSAFAEQHGEGMAHAQAALEKGREALAELAFRRRGLAVSLAVIALVLVALGLKIRQISSD